MVCVIPLAQTVNRAVGCSPFRQQIALMPPLWVRGGIGKMKTTAIWRFAINPAYFVANARPRYIDGHAFLFC